MHEYRVYSINDDCIFFTVVADRISWTDDLILFHDGNDHVCGVAPIINTALVCEIPPSQKPAKELIKP